VSASLADYCFLVYPLIFDECYKDLVLGDVSCRERLALSLPALFSCLLLFEAWWESVDGNAASWIFLSNPPVELVPRDLLLSDRLLRTLNVGSVAYMIQLNSFITICALIF